jgi:hypothetical protein
MNCPNCNASNDPYARFCENCGALILAGASATEAGATQKAANGRDPYAAAQSSSEVPEPSAFQNPAYPGSGDSQPAYGQGAAAGFASAPAASPYTAPYTPATPSTQTAPAAAFGLAIASLVIGILGVVTFGIFGFLGLLGVAFGVIALILRSGYAKRGLYDQHAGSSLGLGIAGIVLNALSLAIFTFIIALAIFAVNADPSFYDELAELEDSLSTTELVEGTHA